MRNDEEFKNEVFKRCEIKKRMEEIRKRKFIGSLYILVIACVVAIPTMLNNNSVPEPNGVDMSVEENAGENPIPVNTEAYTRENALLEFSCKIVNKEQGETSFISDENTGELLSILENAYDTKAGEITEEAGRIVKYEIIFSDDTGEERYFISSDGYIMKGEDSQWKPISEEGQLEIESFIEENSTRE